MVLDSKKLEYYERKYERNPLEDITKYISNKWTLHILRDLFLGKSHFNEFKVNRPSLDNKSLSRCLKTMQENDLIYKTNDSDDSKNTQYFLTQKGKSFNSNVVSLRNFIFLKFFYMSNQLLNYDHFFNFSIIPSLVFKKTNF